MPSTRSVGQIYFHTWKKYSVMKCQSYEDVTATTNKHFDENDNKVFSGIN